MKTVWTIILLAVCFSIGFFTCTNVSAQSSQKDQHSQSTTTNSDTEQANFDNTLLNDKDDRDWGFADWATRTLNKGWHERFGYKRYEPKNLWEWLDDTRQKFKEARKELITDEQKRYLAACQKTREAGIIYDACCNFNPDGINLCAFTGPFSSMYGARDSGLMCKLFAIKAEDNSREVAKEYLKILKQTSKKAQVEVAIAIYKARGKDYVVDHYKLLIASGKFPEHLFGPNSIIYEPIDGPAKVSRFEDWRKIFKDLRKSDKNGFSIVNPILGGGPYGNQLTRDEFLFIDRQFEECWKNVLNPPAELLADLTKTSSLVLSQRCTYWKRDKDGDEPPLILRMQVKISGFGGVQRERLSDFLPWSFLKGLCPDYKNELVTAENALSTDGISPDFVRYCHNLYLAVPGPWVRPPNEEEKKWGNDYRRQILNKDMELYDKYFARERMKWQRVSPEEYEQLKSVQEEWVKTHSDNTSFVGKNMLCANFERMARIYHESSGSSYHIFSLAALENIQGFEFRIRQKETSDGLRKTATSTNESVSQVASPKN